MPSINSSARSRTVSPISPTTLLAQRDSCNFTVVAQGAA